ncbi:plant SNARE 11-like [Pyrus ussuriensis x Pyrus communis]|uniref:Plant SNARE 11-like n=1 Tax=Pyrus ussuriensis x Pyrus communis TaxID=2448454 RepID=A0A5N5H8F3_9ROSA|nr:plant SNARE 11-like [Pyrus ussuriensis x Pyrus communis]
MDPLSAISEELAEIDGQIADIFRAMSLEKIKDSNRQSRQLEELTDKMRDCKRLMKELDREVKNMERINDPNTSRMLNEKKQSMIKELDSYVALKKQ